MTVEAVQNQSLTMSDLTVAGAYSYARSRAELEKPTANRGISYGESAKDLVFESEESLFPWWVPEGVSWLDYLFGTYIRMRIALLPELPGRMGFDDQGVSLLLKEEDLTEEQTAAAGPMLALMRELRSRRADEMEATCRKQSMVAG